MIALDTHTALWWTQQPERLSTKAADSIEQADEVLIPAIVFWEVALLVCKGRVRLSRDQSATAWSRQVLTIPRVHEVPLTHDLAVAADAAAMHADPADRFIATTADHHAAPLVTKDPLLWELTWLRTVW